MMLGRHPAFLCVDQPTLPPKSRRRPDIIQANQSEAEHVAPP